MKPFYYILTITTILLCSCNEVELSSVELKQKFGDFSSDSIKTLSVDYSASNVSKTIQHNLDDYRYLDNVETKRLAFQSNGKFLTGSIVSPKAEGVYPCIILNHDINDSTQKIDISTSVNIMAPLANQGYVVIAYNPSGTGGSEGEFNPITHTKDMYQLFKYLKHFSNIDTSKIGILGINSGNYINYLSLQENKEIIKAAINISGLTSSSLDLHPVVKFYSETLTNSDYNIGFATTSFNATPILNLSCNNLNEYPLSTKLFDKQNISNDLNDINTEHILISDRNLITVNNTKVIDLVHVWFNSQLNRANQYAQKP